MRRASRKATWRVIPFLILCFLVGLLQRTEEAIVVATGAPRESGCPPWVVLGVKAIEAPGVRPA
jgi:hypothetical protein